MLVSVLENLDNSEGKPAESVCVYVCMCVCVCVCLCICVCVFFPSDSLTPLPPLSDTIGGDTLLCNIIHRQVYPQSHIEVCEYLSLCVVLCVSVVECLCVYLYVCVCVCVCASLCQTALSRYMFL